MAATYINIQVQQSLLRDTQLDNQLRAPIITLEDGCTHADSALE